MPLHLQHHKSYHPYNKNNIERVRQDEEKARLEEEEREQKILLAESESRLEILRRRRDDTHNTHQSHDHPLEVQEEDRQRRKRTSEGSQDIERSQKARLNKSDDNSSYLVKTERGLQPWYQDQNLQSEIEKRKTQEQRLEDAFKDSQRKRSQDPIRSMPSMNKLQSRSLTEPTSNVKASSSKDDLRGKAEQRESIERARIQTLLRKREEERSGLQNEITHNQVPTETEREYNDQFYRDDVRAAHQNRNRSGQDFRTGQETIDPGGTGNAIIKKENVECFENEDRSLIPLQPIDSNIHLQRPTSELVSRDSNGSDTSTSSVDSKGRPRESMYPEIFGEMIDTVLESESYLFTKSEQILLRSYANMDYEARHLLARLIQRRNVWHRVDKLRYDFDVKDKATAVTTLCQHNQAILQLKEDPTFDSNTEEDWDMNRFCLSEMDMDEGFDEPLNLLTLEELKVLAKNMNRLKGSTTKSSIISSLLTTKSQGTLQGFTGSNELQSQSAVMREQLTEIVGGCVKVCPKVQNLIDRIALVYYRGAELGGSALTTAVLSKSRKRSYPEYAWKRSEMLFASRKHLIEMQNALQLEIQMDQWIEWDGSREAIANAMSAFETVYEQWKEAVREGELVAHDTYDLSAYNRMRFHPGWPLTRVIYKGVYVLGRLHKHDREAEVLRALLGQRVFRRGRRGDWYDRLALITAHYPPSNTPNAIRKAKREALAIAVQGIEDPDTHLIYQDTLQRRIVRLENQLKLPFSEKHDFSYAKLRQCEDRIFSGIRLDKMMGERKGIFGTKIPISDLGEQNRRSMSRDPSASDEFTFQHRTPLRKVVKVERNTTKKIEEKEGVEDDNAELETTDAPSSIAVERRDVRKDMHSVWRGLDGEPCRVESLVLQHYEKQGYKGFHCEGSVLTMLFALLMWDILFMHVDGVFETPYQRQPLDILEDSFSIVRGPALRQRLMEIENTGGLHLIRETDERERERKTWAIGCRWEEFNLTDLLEIAECMGGKALSVICQMLAEEWSHCTAGMPDLCVWRYEDRQVRFCEVKGPGDKLSDKQKLWIDVLLRAGLYVEVSKVEEKKN